MPDFTLEAKPQLGGFSLTLSETELAEVRGKALISIAVPLGGDTALAEAMEGALGVAVPAPGKTALSTADGLRLLRLQQDMLFALFNHQGDRPVEAVSGRLGEAAYYTDQSDSWCLLRLRGPLARAALERICPLDLHDSAFAGGDVARTTMEHLGAVILRESAGSYLLMSAASSARSFLHAVETSLKNVA